MSARGDFLKLGDRGPKYDPHGRTLKLRSFLSDVYAYPLACDLTEGMVPDEDDLGNAGIGLCALAAPAHKVRWLDQLNKRTPRVDTAKTIAQYSELTGYVPGDESTDNGTYALDVFKAWRKGGLFGLPPIEAFAQVDVTYPGEVAKATFLAGGVFLCLSLPKRVASGDPRDVDIWDVPSDGDFGGDLGGHMVWLHGNACNSWGRQICITDELIAARTYDAFVTFGPDDFLPNGRAYSGLDAEGLRAAVKSVTL
jgi:hypothetical protein